VEIPPCRVSEHEKSVVTRDGWYGREGQRRQRWKCTPVTGEVHRFAEVLPRIVAGSAEHVCPDCATSLEPWEGQPAPRLYGFTARDIATALAMVAGGSSYREVAEAIRIRAGRPLSTDPARTASKVQGKRGKVLQPANRHPQLVSDWVEVFAPIIWSAYAPSAWPPAVAIDEMEFRFGRAGKPRGDKAFSVLAAVGYPHTPQGSVTSLGRPYVAAIEAVGNADIQAWTTLLCSLDGRPGWVVGDGGVPLRAAANAWASGDPSSLEVNLGEQRGLQTWRCEWHLARNISQALPAEISRDRTDRIHQLIPTAVQSVQGWQKLCDELSKRSRRDGSCRGALKVMLNIRPVVLAQDGAAPAGPRSTGAVEEFFRQLENTIGDRASRMTNKTRTDALLKLIAARRNGWADETAWAELIRDHLASTHGRAPDQRRHVDSRSEPSLRPTPR
jgi:hypothetical protein